MEITLRKGKSNVFETALAFLVLLAIIFSIISYLDIESPDTQVGNPFSNYYSNPGIKIILAFRFIAFCIFLSLFVLLCVEKFRKSKIVLTIYLASALAIAGLQWFELYYGSTFYYGEVRDKQGLGFPILSSCMVTLIIWKLNYSQNEDKDLIFKLVLTVLINVGLYQFLGLVSEAWKLWQS